MNNTQASEATEQPKFSPYPLILYACVSSFVSWICFQDFTGIIFVLPGYFCAQVTLLGIIAGMVGRHWLHGMALSLGLQTVICTLAFALDTVNKNDDQIYGITSRYHSSSIILQYSVLTVVLPAIPSLLMRKLQSWRLVSNPTPHKSSSIQELMVATTFVAMITASTIQSYIPAIDYSIVFGAIGACTVAFFLPVVRMSLDGTSVSGAGSSQDGSDFSPRPKAEVVAYCLFLGIAGMLLLIPINPLAALWIGSQYAIFTGCLWIGIWCLGASGLRFRHQQMDDEAHRRSRENSTESERCATGSPDLAQSPFSDDTCNNPQSLRTSPEILGRWSLVMIAMLITGFTLFKIWATQR